MQLINLYHTVEAYILALRFMESKYHGVHDCSHTSERLLALCNWFPKGHDGGSTFESICGPIDGMRSGPSKVSSLGAVEGAGSA